MKTITSRQNQLIKQIASLHKRKNRTRFSQFIAEGFRTCETLHKGNTKLIHLFATERCEKTALQITSKENIIIVLDHVMELISTQKNPPGILGVFTQTNVNIKNARIDKEKTIVLANITDPGNIGTLIRTATAFGYTNIICIEGTDVWGPKIIHASAGTIAHTNIIVCSWQELLAQKKDVRLIALVVKNGTPLQNMSSENAILVIGNEAHGISQDWLETCDERGTITMPGKIESLNASISGAIAMYAMMKQ